MSAQEREPDSSSDTSKENKAEDGPRDGLVPRTIISLLGADAVRNTISPFIDYLETSVIVYERDGSVAGEGLTGNRYCQMLVAAGKQVAESSFLCMIHGRDVALACMESGKQEEAVCPGGLMLCASPIVSERQIVGAVVGGVSEVPSDQKAVVDVAEEYGLDFESLWQAAAESFHRPDYIYRAARGHLERLAQVLGRFYEHALERERSVMEILDREHRLDEANQFLSSLLDGMAEGVYTTDNDGRFTYTNPAVTTTIGYSAAELRRMNTHDIIPPEELAKIKDMRERRRQGLTDSYEIDVLRKDGSRVTISQTVAPLFDAAGEVIGRVGVVTDITERRRMQHQVREQFRRLNLLQSITSRGISGIGSGRVMEILASEVARTLGYDTCSIFIVSGDKSKLNLVARHSDFEEDFEVLNRGDLHSLDGKFGTSPPGRAFLEGKQIVVEDPENFIGYERVREVARQLGSRTMVATPMEYQGEPLGAMVIHMKEAHSFLEDELAFIVDVAAQVSLIAGSALLYHKLTVSEERYRELYDSAADWMYTVDMRGKLVDLNQTMAQALGYSKEELLGMPIYELTTDDEQEQSMQMFEKARAGEVSTFSAERNYRTKDGRNLIVEIHARLVRDESTGEVQGRAVGRDITARKEVEKRANLMAAAVENTRDSVIITDLHGDIVSINRAGAAMFGSTPKELTGMHMGEFWSERNREGLKEEVMSNSLEEGSWEGQLWYQRLDGSDMPVFVSSSLVSDDSGNPVALVGISRDLSEEQRMTREILRRNRELAVMNAIATTAAQSLDLQSTLGACVASIVDSMNYDAGSIYLADPEGDAVTVAATKNIPPEVLDFIGSNRFGEGFAGTIASRREPMFVEELADSPFALPGKSGERCLVTSLAGVPIISRDRLLGVITVSTAETHRFSGDEIALLDSAARTVGVAIENARLFNDVALAKNEWEATFDAMTNGVSIHDRDFTIMRANRALAAMLGTTAQELVGKKCYEVFHDLSGPLAECPHLKALQTGKNITVVLEEPYLGRTLNLSADPIFNSRGEVVGTVHDVRDITEQEHLRDQLNQSEKLRALGEMAGGVAHDFNNFLTVILGNSQLLLATGDRDSETHDALETIQRAATDASETVRRIQEFTRVRTARSFTTVDISRVLANAIEVAKPRWRDEADARSSRISLDVELADVPAVNGNESELGEVFLNLILNAVDAMPEGGTLSVSTGVSKSGMVEAHVIDTGKGMDEDVRKRIFEPFFSTKGPRGSGLGLSLVYGIVGRHGGDVMVESREGEGSEFIVHLPMATVADLTEMEHEMEEAAIGDVRHGRVLVIDDEGMIRTLLTDILEGMGQEVASASGGAEGIEIFSAALAGCQADGGRESGECRAFDLVLTDLGMPEMSGWEVVEKIKAMSPETPVALITGWGDQLESERMKASGVDTVMAKPFKVKEVRALVAKALGQNG